MKMKKKKTKWLMPIVISGLATVLYAMTGQRRRDVYLRDFSVSDDGETLVLDVGTRHKSGGVRAVTAHGNGGALYISFYSAYGVHGRTGAEHIFPIRLPDDCQKIYFGNNTDAWVLTLEKQNDLWQRA